MFHFLEKSITCKICSNSFMSSSHNAIYCGDVCKDIGAKKVDALNRQNKAVGRSVKTYNKTCAYCNSPFVAQLHKQKYCKEECAHQGRLTKRRQSFLVKKKDGVCPHCTIRPITVGFETCAFCRESMRQSNAMKAVKRKKSGLCKDCGCHNCNNSKGAGPLCAHQRIYAPSL